MQSAGQRQVKFEDVSAAPARGEISVRRQMALDAIAKAPLWWLTAKKLSKPKLTLVK